MADEKTNSALRSRLEHGLGSPTLQKAEQDLAVASKKEGSSLLGELGSTTGILQTLLAAGALAAGEEEAAAYLGLQAVSGAADRKVQNNNAVKAGKAAAMSNLAAEQEKVRVEGVDAAQKAFAEDPSMFIGSMMAAGATNDEIDAALNITPAVKTNWSGYMQAQETKETNDKLYATLESRLGEEPNPIHRAEIAKAMLMVKGYKGEDMDMMADAFANGTVDFEKILPNVKDAYTPQSVLNATKATMLSGDPMDGLKLLVPMVKDPESFRATLDKEDRENTLRGQVMLDRIIRETGLLPTEAVEQIEDEELRAHVRDNYTEWGFPGSENQLDMYLDIYERMQADHTEYNRYVRSVFTENWQDLVYKPEDAATAARQALRGYMEQAEGYYADVKARETEGLIQTLTAAGFDVTKSETKEAFGDAIEEARLELGDDAPIDDLRARAIELMQEK